MRSPALAAAVALLGPLAAATPALAAPTAAIKVGSKSFTESVIIAELWAQVAERDGLAVERHHDLGGTRVLWDALGRGDIDLYPEYTGTLTHEILGGSASDEPSLRAALESRGLRMSRSLGFENTYAIGVPKAVAERLGLSRLSDLKAHPELRIGLSNEFLERADGWPALRARYALPQADVRGLAHALAYEALRAGSLDATDLYSTDAEIRSEGLRVLDDDLRHFPPYHAVLVWRADLEARAPRALDAVRKLEALIGAPEMIAMNARAKLDRVPEPRVAADFLAARFAGGRAPPVQAGLLARVAARAAEHLLLVALSLLAAIAAGVPLGIVAARRRRAGALILATVGVIQTVPSLALLVFMIPLLGIGTGPALAALFLYSLLPIVRGTHAGLTGIPHDLAESALALGLPAGARLRLVELPLASRGTLNGIKTSAVINVGTATLGALIGAGGFGQPILTGVRLAHVGLILEGAVPAAALALVVQALFDVSERVFVPRGLRLSPRG